MEVFLLIATRYTYDDLEEVIPLGAFQSENAIRDFLDKSFHTVREYQKNTWEVVIDNRGMFVECLKVPMDMSFLSADDFSNLGRVQL